MARLEALAKYVAALNSPEVFPTQEERLYNQQQQQQQQQQRQQPPQYYKPFPSAEKSHGLFPETRVSKMILSVRSSGFRYGNYSEIWFGSKLYLPRSMSRRGLTFMALSYDLNSFRLWQFDLYPFITAKQVNENLVRLIQRLPEKSYFSMSVKDDIHRNLDYNTRNFLSTVVGSSAILNLQFRDSWAIIVYKQTLTTFRVLGEDHKSVGLARVDVSLPPEDTQQEKEERINITNEPSPLKEEVREGLHAVKKDLDDQLNILQELKTESETLKKQLTAQLEIIRSIKDLVIKNEEAVLALSEELNK